MKRYRILNMEFDARANLLTMPIEESWDPKVQEMHRQNQDQIKHGLLAEFGMADAQAKLKNFADLGAVPCSILAYHNKFFRQVRTAFVMGSYYPALTGACALGERILNHLVLEIRDCYKRTPEYKKVYGKSSFDDWDVAIDTLSAWKVFSATVSKALRELKHMRHQALHFRPEIQHNDRELALKAIGVLGVVIEHQFGAFGASDWILPGTHGAAFLKKSAEQAPFIRTFYLQNCGLVGPYHRIETKNEKWVMVDDFPYESKEISDEEFTNLFNTKT